MASAAVACWARPLLTTFNVELPERAPPPSYFEPATRALAERGETIALVSTQWEMLLPRLSKEYPARDPAGHIAAVSPFGPTQPWYEAGKAWSKNPMLVRMRAALSESAEGDFRFQQRASARDVAEPRTSP